MWLMPGFPEGGGKILDRPIIINSFNLCPITEATTLGTECLECEWIQAVGDDFFCICEDNKNQDELSIKEVIVELLNLLNDGIHTVGRDELIRKISDM